MCFTYSFIFGLFFVALLFKTGDAMRCLNCNDVYNISECIQNAIDCGPGEQCFLEKVTTDAAQVVLNGGCRSDGVCSVMKALAGIGKRDVDRKQRNLVMCASCCNNPADADGPCNAKLCGQAPPKRSAMCLNCLNKASPGACHDRVACQDTQVCGNEITVEGGNVVRYNFYCEDKHICHQAYLDLAPTPAGRKRKSIGHSAGVPICNSCCVGDECNKMDCFVLQKNFTAADFA